MQPVSRAQPRVEPAGWLRKSTKIDYGLDAPVVVAGSAAAGTAAPVGAGIGWAALSRRHRVPAVVLGGWPAVWGIVAVAQAGLMVRGSRAGKLRERDRLLDELPWRGDEWVLDVGCGRGLLLIGRPSGSPLAARSGSTYSANRPRLHSAPAAAGQQQCRGERWPG